VVLHHVAQCAHFLVERAATAHAEVLRHGDLHARYVIAVPDRFEERIGKSKVDQILYGFFTKIMVDAEHRVLGKNPVQGTV
jgi:hypothetical protein